MAWRVREKLRACFGGAAIYHSCDAHQLLHTRIILPYFCADDVAVAERNLGIIWLARSP